MEFALGKLRRRGMEEESQCSTQNKAFKLEGVGVFISIPTPTCIHHHRSKHRGLQYVCNPDIPASQDQEHSDDLDIPASQEHSAKKKLPHGGSKNMTRPLCQFARGEFPTEPPTFETAREVGGGWFYYDPFGGKELGWLGILCCAAFNTPRRGDRLNGNQLQGERPKMYDLRASDGRSP
ncbi:hypothetical protein OROHE_006848 [Orobanche hederae]